MKSEKFEPPKNISYIATITNNSYISICENDITDTLLSSDSHRGGADYIVEADKTACLTAATNMNGNNKCVVIYDKKLFV